MFSINAGATKRHAFICASGTSHGPGGARSKKMKGKRDDEPDSRSYRETPQVCPSLPKASPDAKARRRSVAVWSAVKDKNVTGNSVELIVVPFGRN